MSEIIRMKALYGTEGRRNLLGWRIFFDDGSQLVMYSEVTYPPPEEMAPHQIRIDGVQDGLEKRIAEFFIKYNDGSLEAFLLHDKTTAARFVERAKDLLIDVLPSDIPELFTLENGERGFDYFTGTNIESWDTVPVGIPGTDFDDILAE